MMRRLTLVAALAALAALSGCSDGAGEGLLSPAPEASGEGRLPDAFPVPEDAVETESTVTSGRGVVAQFEVAAPVGRILTFYRTELARNGWRLLSTDSTELFTVFSFAGNGWSGSITVAKGPPTQLAVVVNPEPTTGG